MSSTQEAGEIFGAGRGQAHAMLRSPTVLIASVGLWGMNVFFFRLFRIDYVKILKHDLIKLEELDHENYERHHLLHHHHLPNHQYQLQKHGAFHHKETLDFMDDDGNKSITTSKPLVSPQRTSAQDHMNSTTGITTGSSQPQQQAQQTLIQRQPSAGAPLLAAAAAATTASGSNNESSNDEDEEQGHGHAGSDDNDGGAENYLEASTDPDASITWIRLVVLSMVLLILLHSTYHWWLDVLHGGTIGAIFMFYTVVLLAITLPLRCTRWLRRATVIVLQRTYELINPRCHCITNDGVTPPRFIPFVDVFYADAMCSLSKVFFDWGMLFHMATHYPNPVPASAHNILIPSACAAVPYIIRARQCLIMYTVGRLQKERNRFSHLWNALKYSTSIFPLCLSAYQQTIPKSVAQELESLLIFLLVINSVLALYWDIVMDWGMMQQNPIGVALCNTGSRGAGKDATTVLNPHRAAAPTSCVHSFLRSKLRFGIPMSALILLIDCVLRFSWMLRFYKKAIFPNAEDSFVLCTQFLEVFRRALWNLLRVEWENIKYHSKQQHGGISINHRHKSSPADTTSSVVITSETIGATVEEDFKNLLPSTGKVSLKDTL